MREAWRSAGGHPLANALDGSPRRSRSETRGNGRGTGSSGATKVAAALAGGSTVPKQMENAIREDAQSPAKAHGEGHPNPDLPGLGTPDGPMRTRTLTWRCATRSWAGPKHGTPTNASFRNFRTRKKLWLKPELDCPD